MIEQASVAFPFGFVAEALFLTAFLHREPVSLPDVRAPLGEADTEEGPGLRRSPLYEPLLSQERPLALPARDQIRDQTRSAVGCGRGDTVCPKTVARDGATSLGLRTAVAWSKNRRCLSGH